MSRSQLFLIPVLACVALLATGSFRQDALPTAAIGTECPALPAPQALRTEPAPLPPSLAGSAAGQILEAALRRYGPDNVAWLETDIVQQTAYEELRYRAEGKYLVAPNHRMRLDLKVRTAGAEGRWTMVSDGHVVAEFVGMADFPTATSVVELPRILRPTDDPGEISRQRAQLLQQRGCIGVHPILQRLKDGLQKPWVRGVKWDGRQVVEIRGQWQPDPGRNEGVPEPFQFLKLPREVCLYLDAETLWPARIEWWGGEPADEVNTLLLVTEYRNPVVNQPLAPERAEREFAVTAPGRGGE